MKLVVGIPTMGEPSAPFVTSLGNIALPPDCTGFERFIVSGNFAPAQRELILRRAIALGADVAVMIDDDMIVPPDALVRLCEALAERPRCAVAGALYYTRDGIRPVATSRWSSRDTSSAVIPAFGDGVVEVDGVGFGCVAIRVSAAELLPRPFFTAQIYIEQSLSRVRLANEDFLFCERLRDAFFTIALHAGVRCKHYDRGSGVAYPLDWEPESATAHDRMLVVDPGPTYRLIAADETLARVEERHESVDLDYLFVD